eukprot:SAG31_NODE_2745_length_5147_cov_20.624604_3_plen_71_part_00
MLASKCCIFVSAWRAVRLLNCVTGVVAGAMLFIDVEGCNIAVCPAGGDGADGGPAPSPLSGAAECCSTSR